jgi:predicted enzyme related to lactoylglutathione lyase
MNHPVVRWQMISPKPDASVSFYRQLFGWTVNQDNALGYREMKAGDGGIDGGVWPGPPTERPFVQLFIAVRSVDDCIAEATRLGAKVIVPKSTLPDGDIMAVLLDPVGLPLAICTGKSEG